MATFVEQVDGKSKYVVAPDKGKDYKIPDAWEKIKITRAWDKGISHEIDIGAIGENPISSIIISAPSPIKLAILIGFK